MEADFLQITSGTCLSDIQLVSLQNLRKSFLEKKLNQFLPLCRGRYDLGVTIRKAEIIGWVNTRLIKIKLLCQCSPRIALTSDRVIYAVFSIQVKLDKTDMESVTCSDGMICNISVYRKELCIKLSNPLLTSLKSVILGTLRWHQLSCQQLKHSERQWKW